jgi:hypothetical protein
VHIYVYYKSCVVEITIVTLHIVVRRLFYAAMHSLIMSQWGPKYVGSEVLKVTVILTNFVHLWLYTITKICIHFPPRLHDMHRQRLYRHVTAVYEGMLLSP